MDEREYAALGAVDSHGFMPLLNRIVTRRSMAAGQGVFYLATGIWPLLHMDSFEAITGPKRDRWLVKTVGALVAVTGGLLSVGAVRGRISGDLVGLAAGEAAALTGIDVVYAAKGRISKVYLLDALAEVLLIAGWGHALAHQPRRATSSLATWDAAQDAQPLPPAERPRSLPVRLTGRAVRTIVRRKDASPVGLGQRILKPVRHKIPV